jgi:hypothetical protein
MKIDLVSIVLIALLVEAVVETVKPLWDPEKRKELPDRLAALAGGELVAIFGGFDIFEMAGLPLENIAVVGEWPGIVLTGILLSRGANFVHSLLGSVAELPGRIRPA